MNITKSGSLKTIMFKIIKDRIIPFIKTHLAACYSLNTNKFLLVDYQDH
jgi:hypothetical protein